MTLDTPGTAQADNLNRMEELFHQALELPPSEWASFIDKECVGDAVLRARLEKLLQAHRRASALEEARLVHAPTETAHSLPESSLDIGTIIQSYRVVAKIGSGGMGVVYAAEHLQLGHRAVVKVLRRERIIDRHMADRFMQEAEAAAKIDHPGIVNIIDIGRHRGDELYILMEHLDGESLAARLRRRPRLAVAKAVSFTRQIARALEAVHAHNIVHRDLKPANVLLVPDDEVEGGERVKVLDFGIAKLHSSSSPSMTRTDMVMGTPPYMPPEQWRRAADVDGRADLYALGVMFFEMLCGRLPFRGDHLEDWILAHTQAVPAAVSDHRPVPIAIDRIVACLLAKRPEDRFASARELVDALNAYIHGREVRLPNAAGEPISRPQMTAPEIPRAKRASAKHAAAAIDTCEVPPRPNDHTTAQWKGVRTSGLAATIHADRGKLTSQLSNHGSLGQSEHSGFHSDAQATVIDARMQVATTGWARMRPYLGRAWALLMGLLVVAIVVLLVWRDPVAIEPTPLGTFSAEVRQSPIRPTLTQVRNDLSTLFSGNHEGVQLEIIAAARDVGTPEADWLLYRALKYGTPPIRLAASAALRDLGWPDAAKHIRETLREVGGDVQRYLTADLVWLGDRDGIAILAEALDESAAIAVNTAEALAKAGRTELAKPALSAAVETLPPGSGQWLRAAHGLLLLNEKAGHDALTGELARPERERSIAAAAVLASGGHDKAIAFLKRVLAGRGLAGRGLAGTAHSDMSGDGHAAQELKHRADAALILARISAENPHDAAEIVAFAKNALSATDPYVRRTATAILGRLAIYCDADIQSRLETLALNGDQLIVERDVAITAGIALLAIYDVKNKKTD